MKEELLGKKIRVYFVALGLRVSWGHWTLDGTASARVRVLVVYVPQKLYILFVYNFSKFVLKLSIFILNILKHIISIH